MDQAKFFKDCLPQILLGPLLNTLSHLTFGRIINVKSNFRLSLARMLHGKWKQNKNILRLKTLNLIKFFWFWCKKSVNPRNTNKLQIFITKYINDRSSHQRCSVKKDVLRNFATFTGKHLCQRLLFNKVAGLRRKWWIPKSEKLQFGKIYTISRTYYQKQSSGGVL